MLNTTKLIVNDSYWSLFNTEKRRVQDFVTPSFTELEPNKLTVGQLTRSLALIMQNIDTDETAQYGIEITPNGSSRSSRIPFVRHSKSNQSIWKVVKDIKTFEKGVIELKDICHYLLSTRTNDSLPLPTKVIILASPEVEYINNVYCKFITSKASESNTIVISLEFLLNQIANNMKADLNGLLSKGSVVLTNVPIAL